MAFIVLTLSHGGRTWYLGRDHLTHSDPVLAHEYRTRRAAENALVRRRLKSDTDSAWHHGYVERVGQDWRAYE